MGKWHVMLVAGVIAAACRSTDATTSYASDCSLVGPAVSPGAATLHIGDTLRVTVSTVACPGAPLPSLAPYHWVSNDTSVASVDSALGLVRARRDGTAAIIAVSTPNPAAEGAMALRVLP